MEVPGTVSNILWHFTGGPVWDKSTKKQKIVPKPLNDAYSILKLILTSREIRISNYKELIKVVDLWRMRSSKKEVVNVFESSPVCCLADIPIQYLNYHAKRYGKCAIGFYRESAIRHKFNPIVYALHDSEMLYSIYDGLVNIVNSQVEESMEWLIAINNDLTGNKSKWNNEDTMDDIKEVLKYARKSIEELSAFIKTFSREEFNTVYCEREWRSLSSFHFEENDIAMIVVTKEKDCYNDLIKRKIFSSKVPIMPWENLIQ
jgi:hypothetical protein